MNKTKLGFSLIELIMVMSIMATLIGLITINLVNSQQKASLHSTAQTFISDIRQQQIKAMIGDSEGRETADSYGVHIDPDQYVLFHGAAYTAGDSSNLEISLPTNMRFVSPGGNVIFSRIGGEISVEASVEMQDTTNNNTRTIQLNQYGVVTEVN